MHACKAMQGMLFSNKKNEEKETSLKIHDCVLVVG
jgi:hypothetical protein